MWGRQAYGSMGGLSPMHDCILIRFFFHIQGETMGICIYPDMMDVCMFPDTMGVCMYSDIFTMIRTYACILTCWVYACILTQWTYAHTLTFLLCLAVADTAFQKKGGGGAYVKFSK